MHATAGAGKCAEIVPPLEHRAAKFAAPIAAEATNNQMIRATAKAPSPPPPPARKSQTAQRIPRRSPGRAHSQLGGGKRGAAVTPGGTINNCIPQEPPSQWNYGCRVDARLDVEAELRQMEGAQRRERASSLADIRNS